MHIKLSVMKAVIHEGLTGVYVSGMKSDILFFIFLYFCKTFVTKPKMPTFTKCGEYL